MQSGFLFYMEVDEREKYDGIWACASILHLPKKQLREVWENMYAALKWITGDVRPGRGEEKWLNLLLQKK